MLIAVVLLGSLVCILGITLGVLLTLTQEVNNEPNTANAEIERLRNHFEGPLCVYLIPYDENRYTATLHKHWQKN